MTAPIRSVAVLTPMKPERKPFLRKLDLVAESFSERTAHRGRIGEADVLVTLTLIGMEPARATATWVLDTFAVDHVIVCGVAGGIGRATEVGHLVVPDAVVDQATGETFVPSPLAAVPSDRAGTLIAADDYIYDRTIIEGFERDGVTAIDMETAAVAAVCQARAVGWSVYRGISDHVDETSDDSILKLVRPDGSPEPRALAAYLLRDPRRVRVLAALAKGSNQATNVAADATIAAIRAVAG